MFVSAQGPERPEVARVCMFVCGACILAWSPSLPGFFFFFCSL